MAALIWERVGSFTDSAYRLVHQYEMKDDPFDEEQIIMPPPRFEGEIAGIRFHIALAVSVHEAFRHFDEARHNPEAEIAT